MLVQRCGSCNYGGPSLFNLFNMSAAWQDGEWWFVAAGAGEVGAGTAVGWAAMRPAWGGTNFTNATAPTAKLINGNINLLDTWSPLVIVAADAATYGTLGNFTQQIKAALLTVDAKHAHVDFVWNGRQYGFTPGPGTWKGKWTLPTMGGTPVNIDPDFVYSSPHLNAAVGADVVTASYGNYSLAYDFTTDTITRV